MISIKVHSQNLRGSFQSSLERITFLMNDTDCECTAILLQDIGITGPDGPPLLHQVLGEHKLVTNYSSRNKTRTVAIIIHKSWEVRKLLKDPSGSLVGAVIAKGTFVFLVISAYLPTGLDRFGVPLVWDLHDHTECAQVQSETHSIYATLLEWIHEYPYWLVGGDLNETRGPIDRVRRRQVEQKDKRKFVDMFLEESEGADVWRESLSPDPWFHVSQGFERLFLSLRLFPRLSCTLSECR